jgi:hypothetical protein
VNDVVALAGKIKTSAHIANPMLRRLVNGAVRLKAWPSSPEHRERPSQVREEVARPAPALLSVR